MRVITFTGRRISMATAAGFTIADLKTYLWTTEGIPIATQNIIQHGRSCADEDAVDAHPDALYYLVVTLRGGMFHASSGRQDFRRC